MCCLAAGISAKASVVSNTAVLFGVANINSAHGMSSLMTSLSALGFTSLNAFCLMLFCLFVHTLYWVNATIKKESSLRFMIKMIVFELVVAWLVAFVVYQLGSLIL